MNPPFFLDSPRTVFGVSSFSFDFDFELSSDLSFLLLPSFSLCSSSLSLRSICLSFYPFLFSIPHVFSHLLSTSLHLFFSPPLTSAPTLASFLPFSAPPCHGPPMFSSISPNHLPFCSSPLYFLPWSFSFLSAPPHSAASPSKRCPLQLPKSFHLIRRHTPGALVVHVLSFSSSFQPYTYLHFHVFSLVRRASCPPPEVFPREQFSSLSNITYLPSLSDVPASLFKCIC